MMFIARFAALWLLLASLVAHAAQDKLRPSPEPSDQATEKADDNKEPSPDEDGVEEEDAEEEEEALSVTESSITLDGTTIHYRATAGMQPLLTESGETRASIFHVAYERLDEDGTPLASRPGARPITFCFNGGPGSSAVWLHLGAWGPVRVDMGDAGRLEPRPLETRSQ